MTISKSMNRALFILVAVILLLIGFMNSSSVYAANTNAVVNAPAGALDFIIPERIDLKANGDVTVNVKSGNKMKVSVDRLSVSTTNGWSKVPASTDFAKMKADSRQMAISVNNQDMMNDMVTLGLADTKGLNLTIKTQIGVNKLPINQQVADFVFTISHSRVPLLKGPLFNAKIKPELGIATTITFVQGRSIPQGAKAVDYSETQDGSILGWLEGNTYYISSVDKIAANENCEQMFKDIKGVKSILFENFDTNDTVNMSEMFYLCSDVTNLDTARFNTSKVTNMYCTFADCLSIPTINVANWDTSKVTNMEWLFYKCFNLTSVDVSRWNTSSATSMLAMFANCKKLPYVNTANFNTANVTSMEMMFAYCNVLTKLGVSNFNTANVTNMRSMFYGCESLPTVDVSRWNVSKVTNMEYMFYNCYVIDNLDVSRWDVSQVTSMNATFDRCKSLRTLNVSNWNTANIKNMHAMFFECYALQAIDVSNWNVSNVTSMHGMFSHCTTLSRLAVDRWNTSRVTNMESMFYECRKLQSLNVANWNVSNVTHMSSLFYECNSLSHLNLSSWKATNLMNISGMFLNCRLLTKLDLSGLNASKVTDLYGLFLGCTNLKEIRTPYNIKAGATVSQSTSKAYYDKTNGKTYTGILPTNITTSHHLVDPALVATSGISQAGDGNRLDIGIPKLKGDITIDPCVNLSADGTLFEVSYSYELPQDAVINIVKWEVADDINGTNAYEVVGRNIAEEAIFGKYLRLTVEDSSGVYEGTVSSEWTGEMYEICY